jgi:UDP-glucose 4-epimerase
MGTLSRRDGTLTETVLITGGAGFIGSHLADALVRRGDTVRVYDNLSIGTGNIAHLLDEPRFELVRGDLREAEPTRAAVASCDVVYHLAANPDVRVGATDTRIDFEQNLVATRNLLEAMRTSDSARILVFTSSSTVYGEPATIPTAESYGPLIPISLYGGTKLGCEGLIAAYSHLFDLRAVIYRFANVVGPRCGHGVIYDFLVKLTRDPSTLEILGDGTQRKSYLHVDDCVDAMLFGLGHATAQVALFNVGTEDQVNVRAIAEIVVQELGLHDVVFDYVGGYEGRGWRGDVKQMLLNTAKLRTLGWTPRHSSEAAVRLAARAIRAELGR